MIDHDDARYQNKWASRAPIAWGAASTSLRAGAVCSVSDHPLEDSSPVVLDPVALEERSSVGALIAVAMANEY